MVLGTETIEGVGLCIDALRDGCLSLTQTLEAEAQALSRMDLEQLALIAADREGALEAVISADAALRQSLNEIAGLLNTSENEILRDGPLADAVKGRRAALIDQQERLQQAANRVRVRAQHGLAFFRSAMGTSSAYGAFGQSQHLGPGPIKFHRVV